MGKRDWTRRASASDAIVCIPTGIIGMPCLFRFPDGTVSLIVVDPYGGVRTVFPSGHAASLLLRRFVPTAQPAPAG